MSNDKKSTDKFPRPVVLPDGTVFTAYGVSKASPPITPLSGRGISPAPRPAPTTHKPAVPVDWSFWPASRRVKRDEAIALSLGLDPHSLYGSADGHINPEFCPDNATAILFLKRMNLLAACDSRTNIPLSEFAAWAVSNLPSIPPEFEAIVNATKSNETRALAVAKVTDAMMARNKPIERVYIIQATATHAPAAPNAIEKVGAGDTAIEDEQSEQETNVPPYLTTSDLVGCFGGYMGVDNPGKVLSEYPKWATRNAALVQKGKRGKPSKENRDISAWNPVQFALNLLDKRPLPQLDELGVLQQKHLDTVFGMKSLAKWKSIWIKSKPL